MSTIFIYLATKRRQHRQAVLGNAAATASAIRKSQFSIFSAGTGTGPTSAAAAAEEAVNRQLSEDQSVKSRKMLTTGLKLSKEELDVVQVDVAFLSYVEHGEVNAHVRLDSITYATAEELIAHEETKRRQKQSMGKEAYKHFKWYIKSLKDELDSLGVRRKFKIVHWLISSRNVRAFLIKSEFYPAISIIIAPQIEYWYAASGEGRAKYGTRMRLPSEQEQPPTYIKCREDYCANNCRVCQQAASCLCNLRRRASIPTIDEDVEDLV